ncbi:NUC188 domain-containing protein [Radiomyces spectabilis]|uniref:NUC188 domain-containing protein n=1 Tax=Radiomyces spectabilis TaxID=64574 RepID=UPI00221F334C|nr:NUC188 domain-containing protein [Radiomyces spectabilis]KAI8366103.1 NUC188 domain-containing protein [Radiomyces spectabilis]
MSTDPSGKRPIQEPIVLTGREKRRAMNRDKRKINTGRSPSAEGSPAVGQPMTPSSVASARLREIIGLQSSIRKASFALNTLSFQSLPRGLRRRAASHNVKRLPLRLRDKARQEFSKTPPAPKKRVRITRKRKPKSLVQEFLRRQSKKRWLETHMWHTKRMKMVDIWGYRLARRPNIKSARTMYRSFKHLTVLRDTSFYGVLQVNGLMHDIKLVFDSLTDISVPSIGSARYHRGQRMGHTCLYEQYGYPSRFICPVSYLWRPVKSADDTQMLWLWIHPSSFSQALQIIENAVSNLENRLVKEVQVVDQRDNLLRFELSGPRSTALLQSVLAPVEESQHAQAAGMTSSNGQLWRNIKNLRSSGSLPPGVVIGLTVQDPRIRFPQKVPPRSNHIPPADAVRINNILQNWPNDVAQSDIWDERTRTKLYEEKTTEHTLNERRKQVPLLGLKPEFTPDDNQVPILLIQKGGCDNESRESNSVTAANTEYTEGWIIILPRGWGLPFWKSLVFAGARVAGFDDDRAMLFESGRPCFPFDYPGNQAFDDMWKQYKDEAEAAWKRKPPAHRINYEKLDFKSPFAPDFASLVSKETSDMMDVDTACNQEHSKTPSNFWLLQGSSMISKALASETIEEAQSALASFIRKQCDKRKVPNSDDTFSLHNALIKVSVQNVGSGKPIANALIYAIEEQSIYEQYVKEESSKASNQLNDEPVKSTSDSLSCTAIGCLTNGGYSLMSACGSGIGACTVAGVHRLRQLDERYHREEKMLVLVRNPNTTECKLAQLHILN